MPANKRPTPQDAASASQILLDGLAHGVDVFEILNQLVPLHPRNNTFPGEVFLGLATDALDWSGASRADPVTLEGLRERFLPECAYRGRDKRKLQFAVLAAAAQHGGVEPDLLDEVVWWQTDDFWQYALFAATAYIRVAADQAGLPVSEVCRGPSPAAQTCGQADPPSPVWHLQSTLAAQIVRARTAAQYIRARQLNRPLHTRAPITARPRHGTQRGYGKCDRQLSRSDR